MNVQIVIPARMGASRLPGKPLRSINGKPVLQWCVEAAKATGHPVLVTSPDEAIAQECRRIGVKHVMTRGVVKNGTERVCRALRQVVKYEDALLADSTLIVNIQGDMVRFDPGLVDRMVKVAVEESNKVAGAGIFSLYSLCEDPKTIHDRNNPKVVTDYYDMALLFTRSLIPVWPRGITAEAIRYKMHIGIYGYFWPVLRGLASLPQCKLEIIESLEQLRWLHYRKKIRMLHEPHSTMSINDEVDLVLAEKHLGGK